MLFSLTLFALGKLVIENEVFILSDSNFDSFLSMESDKLVLFHHSLSQISLKLIDEYTEVGQALDLSDSDIIVGKINIFQNPMVKERFNLKHFPVLGLITDGFFIEYHGPRLNKSIVEWVSQRTKRNYFLSKCLGGLESRMNMNNITAVLFAKEESNEAKIFKVISRASWNGELIISTSKVAWTNYEIFQPTLIVFKNLEKEQIKYNGPFEADKMADFLYRISLPKILEFNEQTIEVIFRDLNPVIFILSFDPRDYVDMIHTLRQEFENYIYFCNENLKTADHGRLSEYLRVSKLSQPNAIILDPKKNFRVFKISEKITLESLRVFINDWKNEKLEPEPVKSEKIPNNPYENDVRILVEKNFFDVVYDTSKDVLVYYYTPWCVPCKKLTPEYEKLATELKEYENIIIAKTNLEENDNLNELVDGYPTILLYPANKKSSIEFNGNKDMDGLLKFLREEIKHGKKPC